MPVVINEFEVVAAGPAERQQQGASDSETQRPMPSPTLHDVEHAIVQHAMRGIRVRAY